MPGFYKALKRKKKPKRKPNRTPKKRKSISRSKSRSKTKGKTALEKMIMKEEKGDWTQNWDINSMLNMGSDYPTNIQSISSHEIPSGPPWKYAVSNFPPTAPDPKGIKTKPQQWDSPKDLNFDDELTTQDYKELADKAVEAYLNSLAKGTKKKKKGKKKRKKKRKKKTKKKVKKGGG